jgi:pyruvate dehydrogenase E1 component
VSRLGELLWVVDLNRQSLDRVVPDIQIERLRGMFAAAGWHVQVLKWGRQIGELFERDGGAELRERLEAMPNEEYQRMLRVAYSEISTRMRERSTKRRLPPRSIQN